MFLGFAGQGYKLEENMKLNPGQTGTVGELHRSATTPSR